MLKGLVLVAILALPALSAAEGPIVKQSLCRTTWTAPQTNTDGTPLVDLKEYHIYIADTAAAIPLMTVPTKVVPAPELDPPAGKVGEWLCRGNDKISVGQKYGSISAVDTAGNSSVRSTPPFPFESADDVSPQGATSFKVEAGP